MENFRFKEILKEKGMTAGAVAEKLGITPGALSQAIHGNPTFEKLQRIADALGVEVAELFAPSRNVIRCPHCGAVLEVLEKR